MKSSRAIVPYRPGCRSQIFARLRAINS
jgi:hypothetical protein